MKAGPATMRCRGGPMWPPWADCPKRGNDMKPHRIFLLIPTLLAASAPLCHAAPSISGDYLEARTSDIYTGSCFANSEVNLAGKEAVFAWREIHLGVGEAGAGESRRQRGGLRLARATG